MGSCRRLLLIAVSCGILAGCQNLAIALAGAGASAVIGHRLNGTAHRTFTAPYPAVKKASLAALRKMGIRLDSLNRQQEREIIYARAENRSIEIELEPISKRATRVRVSTQNGGFFLDNATANEIVLQTEKML